MAPKRKEKRCKNCGGTVFSRDISTPSSDIACVTCGQVQEENPIVSEVQFSELSNGAATVQGSFVGADQKRAAGGNLGRNSMDSREQTLMKAKKNIRDIARSLRIADHVSDSAFHWFTLALTNNFVQGRKSQVVYAACLYVACRKEKTHHMLINFSARIQVSVFAVGGTFLRMVKALHITNIPLADPSLFILHFVDQLGFGDLKIKVAKDAVKLCDRMSADWIHQGRRPAGIAGACVLLAARMNNLRRTHTELVAVSHVAEVTLQKRLDEFKKTAGAKMTVSDFRQKSENLETVAPPSFQNNRKKEQRLRKKLDRVEKNLSNMENYDENIQTIFRDGSLSEEDLNAELKRISERQKSIHQRLKDELILEPVPLEAKKVKFDFPQVTTLELLSKISSDPENLEDVDDEELDGILLTEDESAMKTRIWHGLNREFLIEQQQKRLKEEADNAAGHGRPKKRKVKKQEDEEEIINDLIGDGVAEGLKAIGGAQAVKVVMKKKSAKINYKAVPRMFDDM